jgi:hypothetical protein
MRRTTTGESVLRRRQGVQHETTVKLTTDRELRDGQTAMTPAKRFLLIFAHPRSGSTTLAQVLSQHPDVNIVEEPFGNDLVYSLEALDERLEVLVQKPWLATGIKHVYNFAYPFPPDQADAWNQYLLLKAGWTVVFLWRRNLFEATLSNLISRQLQAYDGPTSKQRLQGRPALSPIPVRNFRACYREVQRQIVAYRDCLVADKRSFYEITYEELYGDGVGPHQQLARVNDIIQFAGYPAIQDETTAEAIRRLLAKDNKVNSQATYALIPNLEELRQACA